MFEDEKDYSAKAHKAKIEAVLLIFNRSRDSIIFVVGDNCSTNKKFARLCHVPLVGCYNHRFNLAVNYNKDQQHGYIAVILKIHLLMEFLCKPKMHGWLRKRTSLCPKFHNKTRWSDMITSHDKLKKIIYNQNAESLNTDDDLQDTHFVPPVCSVDDQINFSCNII